MTSSCIVCSENKEEEYLMLSSETSIYVCLSCFHLHKTLSKTIYRNELEYDENLYRSYILKCIENDKDKERLKILNINDKSTIFFDTLLRDILDMTHLPKTSIYTVSLSLNFNPSYFSKHKCFKDTLSEDSVKYLKDAYNSFDLIILNTTLINNLNPNDTLTYCKKLCNDSTNIVGIKYHTISPLEFINTDTSINHFFNTNSLKTLCSKNNFVLNDINYDNINIKNSFYEIVIENENSEVDSKKVVSTLYEEIVDELYDNDTYIYFRNEWCTTLIETGKLLDRYISRGYKLVNITNLYNFKNIKPRDYLDNFLIKNDSIDYQITDLTKSKLNEILLQDSNYIFIIIDLHNFTTISEKIKEYLKELHFDRSKCLIYDISNLITYPI